MAHEKQNLHVIPHFMFRYGRDSGPGIVWKIEVGVGERDEVQVGYEVSVV